MTVIYKASNGLMRSMYMKPAVPKATSNNKERIANLNCLIGLKAPVYFAWFTCQV